VSNRIELVFLLEHSQVLGAGPEVLSDHYESMESCLKSAERGLAAAQFVIGIAYREGCGIEKDEHSAYFWFRRAEQSSVEMVRYSRSLVENLKCALKSEDIEDIERKLAARPMGEKEIVNNELFGVDLTSVKLLSRRVG
jgi:hypothetical protein